MYLHLGNDVVVRKTEVLAVFDLDNSSQSHLTRAFLSGIIGLGGLFAGLLANAGIGLLVLFRTNRDLRENLCIVGICYVFSALTGILIGILF